MTRKKLLSYGTAFLLLVGLYAYVYRDWFRAPEMQIFHRLSSGRPISRQTRTNQVSVGTSVAFGFDRSYQLKEVKIVSVGELASNNSARPLWHLVSDSNSVPVKGFVYGERIR